MKIRIKIDELGSIWIGYVGEQQMRSYISAMPVSSLVHILSDRFGCDMTNRPVWIELVEDKE